ncbi:hypothetical protein PAMP_003913 [Pampus punctatissimus]
MDYHFLHRRSYGGVVAVSQKEEEVDTKTEPLRFGPDCVHDSEMLYQHYTSLCQKRGLCSCLALPHLLGNLASFAARVSEPDTSRAFKSRPPDFPCHVISGGGATTGAQGIQRKVCWVSSEMTADS